MSYPTGLREQVVENIGERIVLPHRITDIHRCALQRELGERFAARNVHETTTSSWCRMLWTL
eukprot:8982984-Pyramimonas_sp.AAC.2